MVEDGHRMVELKMCLAFDLLKMLLTKLCSVRYKSSFQTDACTAQQNNPIV